MRKYSAYQWRGWFLEFDASSLTVEKFCKSIEVSVQSFYKWRRKLKDELIAGLPKPLPPEFVPVSLSSSAASPTLEIELSNGVVLRVSNNVDSLRPLLTLLSESGAQQ